MTAQVTGEQVASWRLTRQPYKVIAAAIAEWAAGKERGTVLPDDDEFGRGLDRVVGPRPFLRAKHLLEAHGVIASDGGPFHVALPLGCSTP
jgi:ADP-heptose:LPS heptosyltransferase